MRWFPEHAHTRGRHPRGSAHAARRVVRELLCDRGGAAFARLFGLPGYAEILRFWRAACAAAGAAARTGRAGRGRAAFREVGTALHDGCCSLTVTRGGGPQ